MKKIRYFFTRYIWWWFVDNIVGGFPVLIKTPDNNGHPRRTTFWVKLDQIIEVSKIEDDYKVNKKNV